MGPTFMNMLPYALGIAVSPVPIITVILMLFSLRPGMNGLSFLFGWAVGIAVPAIVVLMLAIHGGAENAGQPSSLTSALRILGGVLLLVMAIRNWMQRHKPEDATSKPMLMRLVDAVTPWKALLMGFLFADVTNPKNMALTIAGCVEISSSRASSTGTSFLLASFVLIASAGVALPVTLYLMGGDASRRTIEVWRQWLLRHKKTIMAVLFVIFGISFAFRGIAGLLNY